MNTASATAMAPLDITRIRDDFPILRETIRGKPLVYLDNAATAQKPLAVIDAIRDYYLHHNANVHRGVHLLSQRATDLYEATRGKVQRFLNARSDHEIIYVRGTTEAINLVARTFGVTHVKAGDEVVISALEHHSNIVPWQILCAEQGATLRVIPMDDAGVICQETYAKLLQGPVKLVALTHVSNSLGTVNPVREMIAQAHAHGIPVLLDGAQSTPHLPVDVQALDCDFLAFSGHKVCGPTGIGILYGKQALLEAMPPYQGGGDMIRTVTFEKTTYNDLPYKFEAGTPNIADTVGLGAAIDYLTDLGMSRIYAYESELLAYATAKVQALPGLRIIGTAPDKAGVLSFALEGIHPHDIGTFLDYDGIAIRAGHHCAQPVMERLGVEATARASFAFYNTTAEIDRLVEALPRIQEVFG
jgi:cysteine desulfurase / selenocysteine lyase